MMSTSPTRPCAGMRRTAALAACLLLVASASRAQPAESTLYTLVFRGVPLHRALETVAHTAHIDLVYTTDHVAGKFAYCSARDVTPPDLLDCVLEGSGLEYVRSSSGAYVLINSVSAPPALGHLAGSIVDEATGAPLPYANVLLADSRSGTTTNEDGVFTFGSVVSGAHRVIVTYVGYETAVDSVWIEPGGARTIRVALEPAETTLAPIVVNGLTQRLPSSGLGALALSRDDLHADSYSATTDVSRGLSALTGVATQQPLADVHIQGSATGEHVTLLDGAPVRDPVSLGRYLSAFSPLALGRITVQKAGFGAAHGSNLAGVVAVEHEPHRRDGQLIALSVDPLSVNVRFSTQFPLPDGGTGSVMTAVRSSVWDAYRDPSFRSLLESWHAIDPVPASRWIGGNVSETYLSPVQHRPDVAFSDYHAAVRLRMSPFRTLYASAYRARNHLGALLAGAHSFEGSNHLMLTSDRYDWTNWIAQVRHSWLIGARSTLAMQLLGSWNDSDYSYAGLYTPSDPIATPAELAEAAEPHREGLAERPASREVNRINEVTLRSEFRHSLSARSHVEAGTELTHTTSRLLYGNPFVEAFSHRTAVRQAAGYLETRHSLGLRAVVEPSLRLTYLPSRATVYAEPRLAVRYDARAGQLGAIAARVAGGLYRQFVHQVEITNVGATSLAPSSMIWLPSDGTLSPPRAYHAAAEVLLMPDRTWTLSVETFRKWQQRLLLFDYASLTTPPISDVDATLRQQAFMTAASGEAYGGTVRARFDGSRVRPDLSYSYSHVSRRYADRFGGRSQPVPWHAPHRLDANLTVTLFTGVELAGTWQSAWGRRWGLRRSYYDFIGMVTAPGDFGPFDLSDPSSFENPAYHRLDAGLTYEPQLNRIDVKIRLFVTNVLGRRNVFDSSLEPHQGEWSSLERRLPGRHLFFAVQLGY